MKFDFLLLNFPLLFQKRALFAIFDRFPPFCSESEHFSTGTSPRVARALRRAATRPPSAPIGAASKVER